MKIKKYVDKAERNNQFDPKVVESSVIDPVRTKPQKTITEDKTSSVTQVFKEFMNH